MLAHLLHLYFRMSRFPLAAKTRHQATAFEQFAGPVVVASQNSIPALALLTAMIAFPLAISALFGLVPEATVVLDS